MAKDARKRPLRVTHLHLENWRNFSQIHVTLQRRSFLVGPNAAGKSNLLDAFRFVQDIVSVGGGFREAVRKRGGVSRIRCLATRRYPDIVLKLQIGDDEESSLWQYELRFKQDNQRRPIVVKESVLKSGESLLDRPNADDRSDPERLSQTSLEQVNVNQAFRAVPEFFSSIRYLHIVPQLVREPDRSIGRINDPFGGDFLEQVARTPKKTRDAWLRRIKNALIVAVPQLQELELERDIRGTPHLRGKYEHWRAQGAWQTEEDFSDGTLRLMGLLWAALEGTGPLLLEEPELSLHPDVVRFIPQMLARIQRRSGRQALISTHSTDLLRDDGIGLDEVLLLQPGIQGTSVRLASSFLEIAPLLESGSSLADVVVPLTRPQSAEQLSLFGE